MSLTRQDIEDVSEIVRRLYLEDEIPWVLGYSGGKDSTATLQLVWYALSQLTVEQKRHKPIHVISTDTLVESPVVAQWVDSSLNRMREMATGVGLQIKPHRLTPKYEDSFWTNLLGRGYPYPRPTMRWCTERLKIKPANTFVQEVVSSYGEVILLLGTRKAESANRARSMKYYEGLRVRDYLSPNGSMQNELVFSPLEDWTDDDVWMYLMQYENPWGHSNKDLLTMYRGATADGECPIVMDTDTPSCGKSRFGCWVCTMVEQDKSMAAMIMNDTEKEWMLPLLEFRNQIGDAAADRERRDFRRMTGSVLLHRDRLVHGPYCKEVREQWLRQLLQIQVNINKNGPEDFRNLKLITDDELNIIRNIWLNDKHEFDDTLPQIYQEITGEKFPSRERASTFGQEEWALLSKVCHDMLPDEELLFETTARIVDIEKKSVDMKKRKGVLIDVEKQIVRGFYKNEADALLYAREKKSWRKELEGQEEQVTEEQLELVMEDSAN